MLLRLPAPIYTWLVFVAWLAGAAGQLQQAQLAAPVWSVALLLLSLWVLLALSRRRRLGHGAAVLLLLALGTASWTQTAWRASLRLAQQLPAAVIGQDVQVIGQVRGLPQSDGVDVRFVFEPEQVLGQEASLHLPQRLTLAWYSQNSFADAPLTKPAPPALQAGQQWRLTLRLKPIHGSQNPHGFDYELWAFERQLHAGGYVRSGVLLRPAPSGWQLLRPQHWADMVSRWRGSRRDAVYAQVAEPRQAALVAALLMGEQGLISRSDWDLFRATGVAHLVSISGLHIGLFAALAIALIGRLWRLSPSLLRRWPAPYAAWLGGLAMAAAYAYFSGWGVPAQRTTLMLALATGLRLSGRRWPWSVALLAVAAVVVAWDPWALLQAGFWLSFLAVAVLLLPSSHQPDTDTVQALDELEWQALPAWQRRWRQLRGGVLRLLREQLRISWLLAPLSLLLFRQFSLAGIAANMLAIPVVTFIATPLALLGVLFAPLWSLAAWVLGHLLPFLEWCASWPGAVLHSAALPWGLGVAATLAAGAALFAWQRFGRWRWRWLWGVPALALMLWGWRYQPPGPAPGHYRVMFVDVGQGTAVLVQTAGHSLLYDTGPRYGPVDTERNAGERIVLPLLQALGLQPDTVVVSHQDSDHSGGLASLLRRLPPKRLISSMPAQPHGPVGMVDERCIAGQGWEWDGVRFDFLHPQAEDYQRGLDSNAISCVLRIRNGAEQVLLTGDIPQAQEYDLWLQLDAQELASRVLLAPHHGSNTSSSLLFLKAVQPTFVAVQAGYLNRYRHPAPAVMQRYADLGLTVRNTAHCGALRWDSTEPEQLVCWRQAGQRYWWHQSGQ